MKKCISILGSTGSIGTQALEIAEELGIKVCALACKSNVSLLEEQIRRFKPEVVAVESENKAKLLRDNIKDLQVKILTGKEGLCKAASFGRSEMVINAVVGVAGLLPTVCAIENKIDVALANKETLVVGGELVMDLAKKNNVCIFPVDSEHSAIFQCLQGANLKKEVRKLILTASGGPFFGKTKFELESVTKKQALRHPSWDMGPKITIDSATMMNKGFEIIEAKWLFDVSPEDIEVLIHRESIIHSMVEYKDHSVIAQLGTPSMKLPIQYALTFPERVKSSVQPLDLARLGKLTFFKPDYETFDCLKICLEAIRLGGLYPAVVNAANEVAVDLFFNDKIAFLDISKLIRKVMNTYIGSKNAPREASSIDDILEVDKLARDWASEFAK
ncbi:MAG: 1-deoxy-D-xylulose-5-phosphate reductoisomerase [Clostridia bacterium]|nr:1-deoxy-D-xylulose-5-phosphate reductoisomerase [Clostridia bacterium]